MHRELVMNTQHTALYMGSRMEKWRTHQEIHTRTTTHLYREDGRVESL